MSKEDIKKIDLELVDRFNEKLKELCYIMGVQIQTTESGTNIYVLQGSSKPAFDSNLYLIYRGRK